MEAADSVSRSLENCSIAYHIFPQWIAKSPLSIREYRLIEMAIRVLKLFVGQWCILDEQANVRPCPKGLQHLDRQGHLWNRTWRIGLPPLSLQRKLVWIAPFGSLAASESLVVRIHRSPLSQTRSLRNRNLQYLE